MEEQTIAGKWLVNAVKETEQHDLRENTCPELVESQCFKHQHILVNTLAFAFGNIHKNLAQDIIHKYQEVLII